MTQSSALTGRASFSRHVVLKNQFCVLVRVCVGESRRKAWITTRNAARYCGCQSSVAPPSVSCALWGKRRRGNPVSGNKDGRGESAEKVDPLLPRTLRLLGICDGVPERAICQQQVPRHRSGGVPLSFRGRLFQLWIGRIQFMVPVVR